VSWDLEYGVVDVDVFGLGCYLGEDGGGV